MPGYVDRSQEQQLHSFDYNTTSIPTTSFQNGSRSLNDDPPPPYETPDANPQRGPARREWDNVAARIAARTAAARHTSKRLSRGDNPSRVQKAAARKHKPGLSIDTTVTRHIGSTPQQLQLKGTRKRASSGYKKLDEGTQLSYIAPQNSKPQQALPAFDPSSFGPSLVSHFSPETPTIVITPALDIRNTRFGGRAASSLYSRATFAPSFVDHGKVPPLPTNIPLFLEKSQPTVYANGKDSSRDSVATDFEDEDEEEEDVKRHGRVASNATVFEEEMDQIPLAVHARGGENGRELYIDTAIPPTPRRSRGWWNVITTPFENAKSMSRFLRSPTDGSHTPDVPPLPNNMMPTTQQFKENTLSPDSARDAWSPYSHIQNQQYSQNQNIAIKLETKKPAVVDVQRLSPNPETLYPNPRATHNSQALRRLESDELLMSEPLPPLPVPHTGAARESINDTASPNEREVPIVLSFNPTFIVNQPSNPYHPQQNRAPEAAGLGMAMNYPPNYVLQPENVPTQSPQSDMLEAAGHNAAIRAPKGNVAVQEQSPQSGLTEFSPVGQISGSGTVVSSKVVINDGKDALTDTQTRCLHNHSLSSTSRSSLAAEIVKHPSPAMPYRSDDWRSPYYASPQSTHQKDVPQPVQAVAFQPLPRSASQPPTRFSDYTIKTGKVKRKPLMFEICVRKPKEPKGPEDLKKKKKSKRRWWCCCLCFILLLLVGLAIALAILLSRKHTAATQKPTQIQTDSSTFITVSNFPPVPTGTLTIARPDLLTSVSGCVNPGTMWSCSVPKEQQASIQPNSPDQPDFVVNIVYDNSSVQSTRRLRTRQPSSGTFHARSWVKGGLLRGRDASASSAFTPSPAPPTLEDQAFLGSTTDNITSPFEGESTPFFISFTPPALGTPTSKRKVKRQSSSSPSSAASSTVNVIPNIATALPLPSSQPDGTAEPANLLPFPVLQPLRLYNRGLADEHYGFYTYFERNIFMQSISIQNTSQQLMGEIPADENGGSTFVGARARCSWRDTRFKVQIWTNKDNSSSLLPSPSGSTPAKSSAAAQSFVRPGTFPYPVTITLDRHGGGLTTKMLFCYGMDDRGHIDIHAGRFQPENRSFAGVLVNPALGPFTNVNVTASQGGPGGIDGGTGGCLCQWSNFLPK
jgi:hypothetical protein